MRVACCLVVLVFVAGCSHIPPYVVPDVSPAQLADLRSDNGVKINRIDGAKPRTSLLGAVKTKVVAGERHLLVKWVSSNTGSGYTVTTAELALTLEGGHSYRLGTVNEFAWVVSYCHLALTDETAQTKLFLTGPREGETISIEEARDASKSRRPANAS